MPTSSNSGSATGTGTGTGADTGAGNRLYGAIHADENSLYVLPTDVTEKNRLHMQNVRAAGSSQIGSSPPIAPTNPSAVTTPDPNTPPAGFGDGFSSLIVPSNLPVHAAAAFGAIADGRSTRKPAAEVAEGEAGCDADSTPDGCGVTQVFDLGERRLGLGLEGHLQGSR
ncbi:hypothetical protein HK405_014751, partial [Cladochytrium tenue]